MKTKKLLFKGLAKVLLALWLITSAVEMFGYSFSADCGGVTLYFDILSSNTVSVARPGNGDIIPTGVISVPSTVINPNDGREYTVVSVGYGAFYMNDGIVSITLPNGLRSIDYNAFDRCHNLESITWPETLQKIGSFAFSYTNLSSVYIPASVRELGDGLFHGNAQLSTITVAPGNPYYESRGCNAIIKKSTNELIAGCKNTDIENSGVERIDHYAFEGMPLNRNITIPNTVTYIGQWAFKDSGITGIFFGNSSQIMEIADSAFSGCPLSSITLPETLKKIGSEAFYNTNLSSIHIPASVEEIMHNNISALYGCYQLAEITVASGNQYYEDRGCHALIKKSTNELITGCINTDIEHSGVEKIGHNAFEGMPLNRNITIPNSVTIVGKEAFRNSGITGVSFDNSPQVVEIGDYAFQNCSSLTSPSLPSSVIKIGRDILSGTAWYNSQDDGVLYLDECCLGVKGALANVTSIPNNVRVIADYAFSGCTNIQGSLNLNTVVGLGSGCFSGCTGLGPNLTLGSSINYIGRNCFYNCNGITNIDISAMDINVSVSLGVFSGTGWYNSLGDGIIYLSNRCLGPKNYYPEGDITIEDGTQVICDGAFEDAEDLISVHLPSSIRIIETGAFMFCYSLAEINLPNSLEKIGNSAFESCEELSGDLVIPSSVNYIGDYAFGDCALERVFILKNTPPTLGEFSGLEDLPVYVPKGYTTAYESAAGWEDFSDIIGACFFVGGGQAGDNWTGNIGDNWVNSAAATPSDFAVMLHPCNSKSSHTIENMYITKGNTFTVKKPTSKDGASSNVLTVSGTIYNRGDASNFVIEDGAQLVNNTPGVLATVERDIRISTSGAAPKWHLISSPVKGNTNPANVENLLKGANGFNYGLYRFDQRQEDEWRNYYQAPFSLVNVSTSGSAMVEGYMYGYHDESTTEDYNTLGFHGELQPGETQYVITLDADDDYTWVNNNPQTPFNGVNLIGNPFPYNLDSQNDIKIDGNAFTSYYGISYGDSGSEMKVYKTTDGYKDYQAIKPGMGFFVETSASAATSLAEKHKFKINCGSSKDSRKQYASISINAGNEEFTDAAFIQIEEGNMLHKMTLSDKTAKVYVKNNNEDYAALTIDEAKGVLPVCFEAPKLGRYTISVSANNLDLDYMRLIDNLTGEDIDMLLEKEYSFMASKDDNANRFMLVFRNNAAGDETGDDIFAYQNGSDIIVDGDGELQIFDVTGRMVKATAINGIETINMPDNGVYIFRMVGNDIKTQKIVVR